MDDPILRQADAVAAVAEREHDLIAVEAKAAEVAAYYVALRDGGVPETFAAELTLQYQTISSLPALGLAPDED